MNRLYTHVSDAKYNMCDPCGVTRKQTDFNNHTEASWATRIKMCAFLTLFKLNELIVLTFESLLNAHICDTENIAGDLLSSLSPFFSGFML